MSNYTIILSDSREGLDPYVFECLADNLEHAMEQAKDAYPKALVIQGRRYEQHIRQATSN